MLRNNPDNGLQTDRLSRHLVLFSQDMTAVYFVFNVEKATNWRGVFLTQTPLEPRDFACEVCTAEIGTKPEISRPHPRHSRFKVSQRQPYLRRQFCVLCPLVLRGHADVSALLLCEENLREFKQGSDLFSGTLSSGAPKILQPGLPALSQPTGRWRRACHRRVLCHSPTNRVTDLFRVSASVLNPASPSTDPERDIFRAVSQISPYIEACITAQPAVVQDRASLIEALWCLPPHLIESSTSPCLWVIRKPVMFVIGK